MNKSRFQYVHFDTFVSWTVFNTLHRTYQVRKVFLYHTFFFLYVYISFALTASAVNFVGRRGQSISHYEAFVHVLVPRNILWLQEKKGKVLKVVNFAVKLDSLLQCVGLHNLSKIPSKIAALKGSSHS